VEDEDEGRGRDGGRRRGAALEASILEAAWVELREVGYPRVTMEGVAARARTGKQVLYRRWPNRATLVMAAIRHVLGPLHAEPPTQGSLRDDTVEVLRRMAGRVSAVEPGLLVGLLAELRDLDPLLFAGPRSVMQGVLDAAVGRGELVRSDLSRRVVDLPVDLFRYEGFMSGDRVMQATPEAVDTMIAEIVDDVFLPLVHALAGPGSPASAPAGEPARVSPEVSALVDDDAVAAPVLGAVEGRVRP